MGVKMALWTNEHYVVYFNFKTLILISTKYIAAKNKYNII